jgi:hypothetical protein
VGAAQVARIETTSKTASIVLESVVSASFEAFVHRQRVMGRLDQVESCERATVSPKVLAWDKVG